MLYTLKRGGWSCIILSLVVILLLVLGAAGCGNGEEEALNGEDNGEQELNGEDETVDGENELPVAVDNWRNPTGLDEIVDNFEELHWRWANIQGGEEQDATLISYRRLGSDTIEGIETNQISIEIDDEEYIIWLDESGNVVQAEIEGAVLPGELVQSAMQSAVEAVFSPFNIVEQYQVYEFLVDPYPGIEWKTVSTEAEQFGDAEAEVTRLEIDLAPPMVPEGQEGTVTWSVGDFDDFQMLVEYEWAEEALDGRGVSYKLIEVAPR